MKIDYLKLKEARAKIGLTQKELAEKLGISQQFLSQLESGRRTSLGPIQQLAEILGVSVRDICKTEESAELPLLSEKPHRPSATFTLPRRAELVQAVVLNDDKERKILEAYRSNRILREMINRIMRFDEGAKEAS